MINNLRLIFLFEKYLDKNISAQEYEELMVLINKGEHDELLLRLIDDASIDLPTKKLDPVRAESIFNDIIATKSNDITRNSRHSLKKWFYLAASILIVFAAGILWFSGGQSNKIAVKIIHSKSINDHQRIVLNDGSTVVLNKNSSIEYPEKFTGAIREVTLKGEAYFDICHKAHQPFIVNVGSLTVNVLGTAFNVKANKGAKVEVTVARGKVSVSTNRRLLATLLPNRQIKVDAANLHSEELSVDATKSIAWQASDLFFDDVTMASAMQTLGKQFNRQIEFNNEQVKHCTLTGAFTHGESLEQILKVICSFNNAQFKITKTGIIKVGGAGCP
jgi:transmembrane sensor